MAYRWFRNPKVLIVTPLTLILLFLIACGESAAPTLQPSPTGTSAPAPVAGETPVSTSTATPVAHASTSVRCSAGGGSTEDSHLESPRRNLEPV